MNDEILKSKKLVIGTDRTLKLLRNEKLKKIFISNNCDETIKKNIEHDSKIFEVEVVELNMNNEELGSFCKKPFSISVVSIEK